MLTYLIDDDSVSLFIADQMLRFEGFEGTILTFDSNEKALDHLLTHLTVELPRFILLDLNMPLIDGWSFLDALVPHTASLQGQCDIYLLTSSLAWADTAKAKSYGLVKSIIHKPLNEEHVASIIAHASLSEGLNTKH
jgi:CheY-like chemotaxis protein